MVRKTSILVLLSMLVVSPILAQKKRNALVYHEEAEEALAKKDPSHALKTLNECLRIDPYFADCYYTRGVVREQLRDLNGALTDYNIYLELRPDHTEALFSRAMLCYKNGHYEIAKSDLLKLLRLPPRETTTVFFEQDAFVSSTTKIFSTQGTNKAYIFNYIGLVETKLKNYQAAISALDSAIQLNPKDADQFVNRGIAKESDEDPGGAIADYQRALSINPEHSLASHNLGVLIGTFGLVEDSEKLLNESIDGNPNLPYPHAQLAYSRFNRGDYIGALEEYNYAILIDSNDVDYLLNRGLVKEKLKDTDGALADFSKALSIKSNFEKAWFNRGNVLTKLNRLEEAIEDYSLAIFYDPLYAAAYYNRALNKHNLGMKKEACEDLKKAEELGQSIKKSIKAEICKATN